MMAPWSVRIDQSSAQVLFEHLFRNDDDEHGAVLAATVVRTNREVRLLVRTALLARDGIDYVPSERGVKMLTAAFVRDCAAFCAKNKLAYIPVHNHGGVDSVKFSPDDDRSHRRGYPAIAQFIDGPVCALVFAENAAAGEVWLPSDERFPIDKVVVAGKRLRMLRPKPLRVARVAVGTHDRQSLLLGAVGQHILSKLKVGVIGAGGVGSLLIEYLARLGVGHLLVADPERIDETNFSRMPGSTVRDYRPWWWSKRTPKVAIAERVYLRANPKGRFEKIFDDVRLGSVARRFIDCDYIFLAADPMSVRLLFNQLVQQYLIPGVAIGTKARVEENTGKVDEAFSIVRMVLPGLGCLWCNDYISRRLLADEAATAEERSKRRYVDDPAVAVPSVITLNAVGAGFGANLFLFSVTNLGAPEDYDFIQFDALKGRVLRFDARRGVGCPECSNSGRLAAGGTAELTTIIRPATKR